MSSVRIHVDESGLAEICSIATRVRNNALDDMKADAERFVPVDTGDLFLSIDVDHAAGTLHADTEYAAAVEMGSEAHEIPNAWGTGRTVTHPGGPPQPYLRPAAYQQRVLRP
jgi:hypothetical protein